MADETLEQLLAVVETNLTAFHTASSASDASQAALAAAQQDAANKASEVVTARATLDTSKDALKSALDAL